MLSLCLSIPVYCIIVALVVALLIWQEIRVIFFRRKLDAAIVNIEKRNIQLSYLIRSAHSLSSALKKDRLLRFIIEIFGELTKSERIASISALYLIDYNTGKFSYETGFNLDITMLERVTFSLEDAPFNVFRKNRKPAFFNDKENIKSSILKEGKIGVAKEADCAVIVPLVVENEIMGIVVSLCPKATYEFLIKDPYLLQAVAGQASIALGSAVQSELAVLDRLTKVYNHAYFEGRLEQEVLRSNRYKYPVSLFMIDIDHFKAINDTYGHQQGDAILEEVARIIKSNIRVVDLCARYGGEEFAVILPETDLSVYSKRGEEDLEVEVGGAVTRAENLRKTIEQAKIVTPEGSVIKLTISIGIGVKRFPDGALMGKDDIIKEADKQLYFAKQKGRNQVCYT